MFSEIALQIEAQEGERIAVEQMLKSNTAGGDPVKISAGAVVNRTAGLEQIHELLEKVQSYVTTALADPSLASEVLLRQISDAVGCIRKVDSEEFKKMIEGGLQDLLMVMYLGQVTKTQLAMAEKITATLTV